MSLNSAELKNCLKLLILIFLFLNFFLFMKSCESPVKFLRNRKVSWEDRNFINYEKSRNGPGENGSPWLVVDEEELKINKEWLNKEGFYVLANQKMSLTRALPDYRPIRFV